MSLSMLRTYNIIFHSLSLLVVFLHPTIWHMVFARPIPQHGVNSPWPRCKLQKASTAIFHAFIKLNDHSAQYTEKDLSLCDPLSAALSCVKSVLFFRAPLCSLLMLFTSRNFFALSFARLVCLFTCLRRDWIIKSRAEFRPESENG